MTELPEDDLLVLDIHLPLIYHGIVRQTLQVSLEVLKNHVTETGIYTQGFFCSYKTLLVNSKISFFNSENDSFTVCLSQLCSLSLKAELK